MSDDRKLSLHAQIVVKLAEDWEPGPVDIIAHTARELIETVRELRAHEAEVSGGAPQPQPEQAAPTPTPGPTAAQTAPQPTPTAQPGPSAAATAPAPAATPSATETAAQPSQPSVTLNDVLGSARQLLQQPKGEDDLRKILGRVGSESISQSNPDHYEWIKYAIDQVVAGQPVDTIIA